MDLTKYMVIIDEKIVTDQIKNLTFNHYDNTYDIQYKNKINNYSCNDVKYLRNPEHFNGRGFLVFSHGKRLTNIEDIYKFKDNDCSYYHIVFVNHSYKDYHGKDLKIVVQQNVSVLDYMKEVADVVSLKTEDGQKILSKQLQKIQVDSLNTALANYLKLSDDLTKLNDVETLIFPFGCNSSQYKAVENAIYNKISVVEGPPGTGKTQTILNIIANVIIRNMNCQVVSYNNTATQNIQDKLKNRYQLDFFVALLGKREKKDLFLETQTEIIPDFSEFEKLDLNDIEIKLNHIRQIVKQFYDTKKEISILIQKENDLKLEYEYFKSLVESQKLNLIELKKYNADKVKLLWNELISMNQISFWNKLKFIYLYKIGDFNFYRQNMNLILKSLQNIIYLSDLEKIEQERNEKERFIKSNEKIEEEFIEYSMMYFKKYLSVKYQKGRKKYTSADFWQNGKEFLNDYPVVLSTTYSSRNTLNNDLKFDYIIMDEASQIDVVTGILALSSARFAVIIGDDKQLTNVIKPKVASMVDEIFNKYEIDKSYSYTLNNFLVSIKNTIPNIKVQLLVEHYRCHPKIINFCNKKFYNNELVIMSKDQGEQDVIKVIRTSKGNHMRGLSNQRQVDEIKDLIPTLKDQDIGIIAPYNEQVQLIKQNVSDYEVNTVHKYQGREKNVIIISTVEDDIGDFAGDSKLLNVAISRAIKQLIVIVTGNEIKNQNIKDFINYVNYNNMEIVNSKIYSSFDLLYKQYELERLNFFKKHQRILKFDSENLIYYLIIDILKNYEHLNFHFHQSLNDLIKDKSLLNEEEKKYASHYNTHIDFYIFNTIGDVPVLVIEVDGYNNHKEGTEQYQRDLLKDEILSKYHIPCIRLKTNGSGEKERIISKLNEVVHPK